MKKLTILLITVLGTLGVFAQNRSINFIEDKTFAELKELAKKENKMIFIDFYTTWCGPCKWMDKNVYTNDSIADFFNSHFINIKIDAEKGEGIELRKIYSVNAFPTFIFVSQGGNMVHRSLGSHKPGEFIQLGTDALNPAKQFSKLIELYYKDKKTVDFTVKFLDELDMYGLSAEAEKIIDDYLGRTKDEDVTPEMSQRIVDYTKSVNSLGFKFILRNFDGLLVSSGDSIVKTKIISVLSRGIWDTKKDSTNDLKMYQSDIKDMTVTSTRNHYLLNGVELISYLNLSEKWSVDKWSQFYPAIDSGLVEEFVWYNPFILNSCVLNMSEYTTDKIRLRRASQWAKRSCDLWQDPDNFHLYSRILSSLSEHAQAVENQVKAVDLAEKRKYPQARIEFFQSELQRFKALQNH